MNNEQPMQEPNDLTPPAETGASTDEAKPKRTRRTKTVDEAAAGADATPAPARKTSTRRRKVDAEAADTASTDAAVEAPAPEVAAEAPAPVKPRRAPRKAREADGDATEAVPAAVPTAAVVADEARVEAGDGFLALAPSADATEAVVAVADAGDDAQAPTGEAPTGEARGDRRERRDRRDRRDRDRGPRADGGERADARPSAGDGEVDSAAADGDDGRPSRRAVIAAEQAQAVFNELLSGDFDKAREEEAAADAEEAGQTKRVLRPEPDAPKLQKVLAQSGVGSRRDIEQMIEDGRISVNGEVAHIGQRVSFGDKIAVGGKPIRVRIAPPPARILAYHKPVGEVVTHDDPQDRPTVFRRLPRLQHGKWQSVGRLDLNTEGLLLFTNNCDLANQLMHPRFNVEREYAVRVLGSLTPDARARLLEGVDIEGQTASFKAIEDGGGEGVNRWYRVVITEGRNREVRKLFDAVGLTVSRLIRVRYGSIVLPLGLKRGVWVELGESDVRAVKALAGGDRPNDGQQGGRRDDRQGGRQQQQQQRQGGGSQGKFGKGQGGGQSPRQGQPQGQGPGRGGPQGGQKGGYDRPQGGARPQRDERPNDRSDDDDDVDHIGPIPNPLEQTFDRRFAKGSKKITAGFGRPDQQDQQRAQRKSGGPREPDPLQTSVGYIGADAYFGKTGGGGGGGGRGGRGGGGRRR